MRKKLVAMLMSGLMVSMVMAGCGNNGADNRTEPNSNSNGEGGLTTDEITLKVWESSGETEEFIKQAGEEFTKLYPNITIEYENVELGDANTQIALDGPGGVGADVFATPSNTIGGLVAGGHILAVDEEDVVGKVAASCEAAVTYDGKIYGYPVSDETYALFYNKDLIEEAPTTWEEVEEFCKEFNSGSKYGIIWNVASCEDAGMNSGVAPLPTLPGDENPAASFSGARTMQVSAYTDYPEEAKEFAKFLISEEMQQLRFELTGAIPSVDIEVESEYMAGFQAQLEYAYPMPSIAEIDNFWDPMNNACSNVWDGADVKKEMDTVNSSVLQR